MSSELAPADADITSAPSTPATSVGVALSVRDVSKCYEIYSRPIDRLKQTLWRGKRRFYREFWALRNISFDVQRGTALGIIGRNGSGKSTILQIIAGALRPTQGVVEVQGKVAALLELGSGFNPEFTGRENAYLNGSILGLSQREIDDRFDEIAAFADIGEFIEQPVKTYSTGMVVRLAFSVQALLEPDILIIDEALAVGDEGFQRKCFAWLERFRANGGTLLFVTHGAQTVIRLCDQTVLLDQGRMLARGPSKPVVDVYQKMLYGTPAQRDDLRRALGAVGGHAEQLDVFATGEPASENGLKVVADKSSSGSGIAAVEVESISSSCDPNMIRPPETAYGTGEAEIVDVGMFDQKGRSANVLVCGQSCEWRYRVRFDAAEHGIRFGMMIKTKDGLDVAGISSAYLGMDVGQVEPGQVIEVRFKLVMNLSPGTYFLNSGVSCLRGNEEVYLHRRVDVAAIRVVPGDRREIYGVAYVNPEMSYTFVKTDRMAHV